MNVVAVLGGTRSGTTLLDRLLGSAPAAVSTGELRTLWQKLQDGANCGCGDRLDDCPFWTEVLRGVGPGPSPADVVQLQHQYFRNRHAGRAARRLRRGGTSVGGHGPMDAYTALLHRVYVQVGRVAGATTVVDSSKRPTDTLAAAMGDDVVAVHLVRDPRDTVAAWSRPKPSPGDPSSHMATLGLARSTYSWLSLNLGAAHCCRVLGAGRWARVRYEDLVDDPWNSLDHLADLTGLDVPAPDSSRVVDLPRHHMVDGNVDKFLSGPTTIRPRQTGDPALGPVRWWAVTLATFPLLVRYGYPIRRSRTRRGA